MFIINVGIYTRKKIRANSVFSHIFPSIHGEKSNSRITRMFEFKILIGAAILPTRVTRPTNNECALALNARRMYDRRIKYTNNDIRVYIIV